LFPKYVAFCSRPKFFQCLAYVVFIVLGATRVLQHLVFISSPLWYLCHNFSANRPTVQCIVFCLAAQCLWLALARSCVKSFYSPLADKRHHSDFVVRSQLLNSLHSFHSFNRKSTYPTCPNWSYSWISRYHQERKLRACLNMCCQVPKPLRQCFKTARPMKQAVAAFIGFIHPAWMGMWILRARKQYLTLIKPREAKLQ